MAALVVACIQIGRKKFYAVSAFSRPNGDIEQTLNYLEGVAIRVIGQQLIIGIDSNVKSILLRWGPEKVTGGEGKWSSS